MMKLSHTALFLAAAVVLLATGLPTSPKEVLESIGKADTIVPEGEAAAVEITQKAQTHNNHKDAAPKLGGLQLVPGLLNQPCKTDASMGSFCDGEAEEENEEEIWKTREEDEEAEVKADILSSSGVQNIWQNVKLKGGGVIKLEAKCIYGVEYGTVCNGGPAGCEKNENYYGTWRCGVCKCVKPAPKPAPLCKFHYACFKDMHKFDKSRYMSPDGAICTLSIVDQLAWVGTDMIHPCQREDPSYAVRRYLETQQAKDLQMACKKRLKCPTGCTVNPNGATLQVCEGGRILDLDSSQWWTLVK